jgi:hypothetical protein
MSAQIFDRRAFLWKLVERDIDAFVNGRGPDKEKGNVGRFLHSLELFDEVPLVRECWADARAELKRRQSA